MMERLSLAGLGRLGVPYEQAIHACVAAGATGMGLHERDLPTTGDRAAADLFVAHGLRATMATPALETVLPAPGGPGPEAVEERVEQLCSSVRRFAIFDPTAIRFRLGDTSGLTEGEVHTILVAALRKIARVAGEVCPQGLRVAVLIDEATGPDDALTPRTVPELATAVGEENLALAYDVDRPGVTDPGPAALQRVTDDLAGVRVPYRATDEHDGLLRLLRAVKQAGYDGWYELDVAGMDQPPADAPATVLAERVAAFAALDAEATQSLSEQAS